MFVIKSLLEIKYGKVITNKWEQDLEKYKATVSNIN